MLDELTTLTNQEDFWGNWHLRLEHAYYSNNTFTFTVSTKMDADPPAKHTLKFWELTCTGVVEEKLIDRLRVPNSNISLLKDHPLLWKYEQSVILTVSGKAQSVPNLLGELFQVHLEKTGNWIDFTDVSGGIYWNLAKKGKANMEVPERLLPTYKSILESHHLQVDVSEGWEGDENLKVLFIGNRNISPDEYSFGQAYVIGKEFSAKTVAPNSGLAQAGLTNKD